MARIILALLHLRYHIVWVDEFSTNDTNHSHYMWQHKINQNAFITGSRVVSWTSFSAMSAEGFRFVKSKQGTYGSSDFIEYLEELIAELR